MLVLLYVQIVQTNRNKSNWKEKEKKLWSKQAKNMRTCPKKKKQKILIKKI
jgi:hypothetical protein